MFSVGLYVILDPTKPGGDYFFSEIGDRHFDHLPIYLGFSGARKGDRPASHWNNFIKFGNHKNYLLNEKFNAIKSSGIKPITVFLCDTGKIYSAADKSNQNFIDAKTHFLNLEEPFIQAIGRIQPLNSGDKIGPLCNIAEGGGKYPVFEKLPEESKARMRNRWKKGFTLEQMVRGGKTAGKTAWKNLVAKTTNEQRSKAGKIGGKIGGKKVIGILHEMVRQRFQESVKHMEPYKDMILYWKNEEGWSFDKIAEELNRIGVKRKRAINRRNTVPKHTKTSVFRIVWHWNHVIG